MQGSLALEILEDQNGPVNKKESTNYGEVILGFVLGTVSMVLGSLFIAANCNLSFPTPPNGFACRTSGSDLLVPVGIILIPFGAVVVIASIAVFRGKKRV
jgi:hypothetical protein